MPSRYAGRHRSATASGRGRHRAAAARRGTALKPLAVSAVSLGLTFAIVQTATSSPFGEATRASALGHPAEQAVAMAAVTDSATTAAADASPTTTAGPTPGPTVTASPSTTSATSLPVVPPAPPVATVDPAKVWLLPVTGATFTSGYGMRWGAMHRGIDLADPIGTPLVAMSSGVVTFAGQQSGYGNIVQIRYWDGTISYYGHMNSIAVKVGQPVTPGQLVGQLGNTGESTGPHVHLEIHPGGGGDVDPEPWLLAHGLKAR